MLRAGGRAVLGCGQHREGSQHHQRLGFMYFWRNFEIILIKYLDVGPQAQLPPPYAEDISDLLTML